VRRDGRHVVAAVFGGASAASRNALMRALLSRALAKASTEKTRKPILVARPRPVHRPAAAVATAPPRPEPRKIAAVATAPAAAPSVPTAPPEAVADATAAAPRAQIEIARVRRVMVAPRPRKARAADDATGTEEPPAEAGSVRTPPPPAAAPAMVREATAAEPPPIRPPAAAVAPPQRSATPPAGIGRPPSTLQAQALAIPSGAPEGPLAVAAAGAHPSAYRLQGPAAPAPASNGPFHIPVGAYGTAGEAERQLATVKGRAAALLSARPTVALPVQKGPRHLYRARFAGFDATGAASACLELRRLGVDCFVMRGE
jgi:D-alanyl-D-alanine carboxypeptidase